MIPNRGKPTILERQIRSLHGHIDSGFFARFCLSFPVFVWLLLFRLFYEKVHLDPDAENCPAVLSNSVRCSFGISNIWSVSAFNCAKIAMHRSISSEVMAFLSCITDVIRL